MSGSLREGPAVVSRAALSQDVFSLRALVPSRGVVVLRSSSSRVVAGALLALEGWADHVHLAGHLPVPSPAPGVVEIGDEVLDRSLSVTHDAGRRDTPSATTWTLYTSGTTGAPKPVGHTLSSLSRSVRLGRADSAPLTWGLLYDPTRMAGVQVLLQALMSGADLVDGRQAGSLSASVETFVVHGVDALSATPTLWRQVLQTPGSERLALRQVTLGGEIADQKLLDALRRAYPQARTTHVFASTETAAAFSVHDGRAGFPAAYLAEPPHGVRLEVRDGVLHVFAPGSSAARADGFAPTGDMVELVGDRVLFRGRQSGMVNIGGVKVWPEDVEDVLRSHEDVVDAVVISRQNAFSGQILTAYVVPAADVDRRALSASARALCSRELAAAAVPAIVKVVDELPTSVTGKAQRR